MAVRPRAGWWVRTPTLAPQTETPGRLTAADEDEDEDEEEEEEDDDIVAEILDPVVLETRGLKPARKTQATPLASCHRRSKSRDRPGACAISRAKR